MLLVIALLGPGPGGVYGVVTRIVQAGNMLEAALRIVLGPRLSAAIVRDDHAQAEHLYRQATQLLILGSWPFYLAVALFADVVLGLFGPEFTLGAAALVVLASAMALKNTAGALQTVLLMAGHSTWQLRNKTIQLAVLLALVPPLVQWWGLSGAAIAFAFSIVVDTVLASSGAPGPGHHGTAAHGRGHCAAARADPPDRFGAGAPACRRIRPPAAAVRPRRRAARLQPRPVRAPQEGRAAR